MRRAVAAAYDRLRCSEGARTSSTLCPPHLCHPASSPTCVTLWAPHLYYPVAPPPVLPCGPPTCTPCRLPICITPWLVWGWRSHLRHPVPVWSHHRLHLGVGDGPPTCISLWPLWGWRSHLRHPVPVWSHHRLHLRVGDGPPTCISLWPLWGWRSHLRHPVPVWSHHRLHLGVGDGQTRRRVDEAVDDLSDGCAAVGTRQKGGEHRRGDLASGRAGEEFDYL
jgi:hypothetical protein